MDLDKNQRKAADAYREALEKNRQHREAEQERRARQEGQRGSGRTRSGR